ncbi:PIG-L family deacetylase [Actinopolymorpha sp. B11F2]|uniref:PIG-L family deacetylase n=1 Tax=Actinopolymorpha sp. B11F2 TaxID=3160862 RepID=UPI0032E3C52E
MTAIPEATGARGVPLPRGRETRVLGVFAHPDDETFFAGATLAAYAAAGCTVRLVSLTAGEAGVVGVAAARAAANEPDQVAIEAAADRGVVRYARACQALGVRDSGVIGGRRWRDLGPVPVPGSLAGPLAASSAEPLAGTPAEPSTGALAEAGAIGPVVACVKQTLTEVSPDVVLTVSDNGVTGHPDHITCHQAVRQALGLLAAEGRKVPLTLGGCVRTKDVRVAWERLALLTPTRPLGEGGIRGCATEEDLVALQFTEPSVQAKRTALDAYAPGLGTQPLAALVAGQTSVGDGVLLRAIAEVAGMDREFFQPLVHG